MVTKQELIDAYADWLSQWSWDWFGTLTHPGYPSRTTVANKFARWISDLQKKDGTHAFRYVVVMEAGAFEDNYHAHVLIGGVKRNARIFPFPWKYQWQKIAGQAVLTRFDPTKGGIKYLLKTLLPDRDFDITLKLNHRPEGGAQI